jgi:hypothetical protein
MRARIDPVGAAQHDSHRRPSHMASDGARQLVSDSDRDLPRDARARHCQVGGRCRDVAGGGA